MPIAIELMASVGTLNCVLGMNVCGNTFIMSQDGRKNLLWSYGKVHVIIVLWQRNDVCWERTVKVKVEVKVKVTLVQALRLCIGRTAHRGSRGIGKVKVPLCTGTEALYRPYGP